MVREGNIEGGLLRAQNMPHDCLAGNATVLAKNRFSDPRKTKAT
jgi:hypothetical protein